MNPVLCRVLIKICMFYLFGSNVVASLWQAFLFDALGDPSYLDKPLTTSRWVSLRRTQLFWAESWHTLQLLWAASQLLSNYLPATLSWNITHIATVLNYFPATLSPSTTHMVAALIYFPAALALNLTHVSAPLSYFPAALELIYDRHCSCSEFSLCYYQFLLETSQLLSSYFEQLPGCFLATLSWITIHMIAVLSYFPAAFLLLPSYFELEHDATHCGCSELLPSYSELIYQTNWSCSELSYC